MIKNVSSILLLVLVFSFSSCTKSKEEVIPISSELLYFRYAKDATNTTSRLEYAIKFTNLNLYSIKGSFEIFMKFDDNEAIFTTIGPAPCKSIEGNSSCIYTIDTDGIRVENNALVNTITFERVEYSIEE